MEKSLDSELKDPDSATTYLSDVEKVMSPLCILAS